MIYIYIYRERERERELLNPFEQSPYFILGNAEAVSGVFNGNSPNLFNCKCKILGDLGCVA
jgi:hypothetical protein